MVGERTKETWRSIARRNRAGVRVDHERVCRGLRHFLAGLDPGVVVLFDPLEGEPDLTSLVTSVPDRTFALTRTPDDGRVLSVHPFAPPFEQHRYGFRQPTAAAPVIDDARLVAVCVPGLVFDRHGGRLGFGAGYYDRFLGRLDPSVLRIGISDGFVVDRLPTEPHDQPMTHLASEAGVFELPLRGN